MKMKNSFRYSLERSIPIWVYWILFSGLGGLIGKLITFDTTGIDFALTALFVVILIEQWKGCESKIPGIVAVISSILWIVIVGADNFLLPSLVTTVSVMILMKKKSRIQLRRRWNKCRFQ